MRTADQSSVVTMLDGRRRWRQKSPRWPACWDRTLDASWTPIARIRHAVEQAQSVVGARQAVVRTKLRAHQKNKERKGSDIIEAASLESEQYAWAIVWLLRWMFDRADVRSVQKEGRRAAASHRLGWAP